MSNCPKCNDKLEIRPNAYYFRGKYFDGTVCMSCKSLWSEGCEGFKAFIEWAEYKSKIDNEAECGEYGN